MAARARRLLQDTTGVWRTLIAGSSLTIAWQSQQQQRHSSRRRTDPEFQRHRSLFSPTVSLAEGSLRSGGTSQQQQQNVDDDESKMELPALAVATKKSIANKKDRPRKVYDFIVVGYGNAGRSAVETLQQECPSASIALLDPLNRPPAPKKQQGSSKHLDYFETRCVGLSPQDHVVETDTLQDDLQYKHALLISSGARGAVPPSYLFDDKSRNHLFELRPTVLPVQVSMDENQHLQQRPVLSSEQVRHQVLKRARAGASVGVLGCGFDAIDMVVEASLAGSASHKTMKRNRPVIIFGSHGPANHILPNYLCSALAKRLKSKRIDVLDRTLIRYISHNDNDSKGTNQHQQPHLNVYTAKSFDFLDGKTTALDALVIVPETSGARGTGTLPTDDVPEFLEDTAKGRSWYQTWSALSVAERHDPCMLVCYKDDGRIAVNPELCACTGVYAAGSVAKYANSVTGHAAVAGIGVEDGAAAGRTAARNMARHFFAGSSSSSSLLGFGSSSRDVSRTATVVKDPLPVWRSDLRYSAVNQTEPTSLSEIGVTVLCVGNCDAESMSTHGVWWSNHAAFQRRLTRRRTQDNNNEDDNSDAESHRRRKERQRQKREIKKSLKPVYGLGVVYYLDNVGRIQGVLTWGLPFTESHQSSKLNEQLVEQMKNVIRTNGGIRTLESESDHMNMAKFLGTTSQQLLVTALQSHGDEFSKAHQLDSSNFPRPLHRYTDVRPASVRSVRVLKRKDGLHGQGVLGEDLYARLEDDHTADAPPPRPAPTGNVGSAAQEVAQYEARYNWSVWDQKERRWDENEARARPPKEEQLWIRKGDETRNIPAAERVASAYKNMLNG